MQLPSSALAGLARRGAIGAVTSERLGGALDALLVQRAAAERAGREPLPPPPAAYAGFDPTASSLHVGHLVTLNVLRSLQKAGVRPIVLVGGATGAIGDPSGRDSERPLQSAETLRSNVASMMRGIEQLIDFHCPVAPALLLDNADWYGRMDAITLLRDVGRHFRLNTMLARDSVKQRRGEEGGEGISFTELSYQMLQGYDFMHLHRNHGCVLQVGGSDQWGNITAGLELIRRTRDDSDVATDAAAANAAAPPAAFGLTVPLLTTASGQKYGKSAGNALWLDPTMTSDFELLQHFLRAEDDDVEGLLKLLTDMPLERIETLMAVHTAAPERREAQNVLADEMLGRVRGDAALASAQATTRALYGGGSLEGLSAQALRDALVDAPSVRLARSAVEGHPLVDIVLKSGAVRSKKECARLVKSGGLYLNNERVESTAGISVTSELFIAEGSVILLRSGKRKYFVVFIEEDL